MKGEFKQPSSLWYKEYIKTHSTRITSPDGWDRENYSYSFYVEEVSYDEFIRRLLNSACSGVVIDWKNNNI